MCCAWTQTQVRGKRKPGAGGRRRQVTGGSLTLACMHMHLGKGRHQHSTSTGVGQVVSGMPASRLWISGERAAVVPLRQGGPAILRLPPHAAAASLSTLRERAEHRRCRKEGQLLLAAGDEGTPSPQASCQPASGNLSRCATAIPTTPLAVPPPCTLHGVAPARRMVRKVARAAAGARMLGRGCTVEPFWRSTPPAAAAYGSG